MLSESAEYAGKAIQKNLLISFETEKGVFSFPAALIKPAGAAAPRVLVHLCFQKEIPNKYIPAEEIIDEGYALAVIYYKDVTSDDGDMENGLAGRFEWRGNAAWGKIGMWACAASRLIDFLIDSGMAGEGRLAVVGHSRLGKTALWCGARDERISLVVSNDSGCSGAALSRGKSGESIEDITRVFPFWFCGNYRNFAGREGDMPFDQHFLLAAAAPRRVYVASAEDDAWADPKSEFLCALAAGEAYEALGLRGLVTEDRFPKAGEALHGGHIAYHMRKGTHFLSREDWQNVIKYWNSAGKKSPGAEEK